jgi:hypothetical protein
MDRLFSAMENKEDRVLDQIGHDIQLAKENNVLETKEYKITKDGKDVIIHDNIHNQDTKVTSGPDGFEMEDVTGKITHKFSNTESTEAVKDSVVLDKTGKLIKVCGKDNAEKYCKQNEGCKCCSITEYRSQLNEKFKDFSENSRNTIINNIFSAVENC